MLFKGKVFFPMWHCILCDYTFPRLHFEFSFHVESKKWKKKILKVAFVEHYNNSCHLSLMTFFFTASCTDYTSKHANVMVPLWFIKGLALKKIPSGRN